MPGRNSLAVDIVATTSGLNEGLAKAEAQLQTFGATVNRASDTEAARASEQAFAATAQATANTFVASRTAIQEAERRASAALKAGAKLSADATGQAVDQMTAAYIRYKNEAVSAFNTMSFHQQQMLGSFNALMDKTIAKQYEDLVARYDENVAVEEVTASLNKNTVSLTFNAQAQREAAFAAGELATGRFGRLETSLLSLSARTGLMTRVLSPLGLAIGGAAAAVGIFTAGVIGGERESAAFNRAIFSTNNAVGLTEGQFDSMASVIASGNITIGAAKDALLGLAQSGHFTSDTLEQATIAVTDFAAVTGEKSQEALSTIERLATGGTAALVKLDEQYHFLTVSQFEHIEKLRAEGDAAAATQASVEAFADAFHQRAQQMEADQGYLITGFHGLEEAASFVWDRVKSVGRDTSVEEQIARVKTQLAGLGNGYSMSRFGVDFESSSRTQLQAQLRLLEATKARQDALAKQKAEQDQLTAAAVKGVGFLDSVTKKSLTAEQQQIEHLKESLEAIYKANPNDSRIKGMFQGAKLDTSSSGYEQLVADIQKKFNEHPINLRLSGAAVGKDLYKISEQEIREANQTLNEINRATQQADQQRLVYAQKVADDKQRISEQEIAQANRTLDAIARAERKADAQRLRDHQRMVRSIEQTEDGFLRNVLTGHLTLQGALRSVEQQIAMNAIEWAAHAATEKLILTEAGAAKELAVRAAMALKTFAIDTGLAAIGAFKAMVGIPYVGPILAVAAAGAAIAEASKFKNMAHLDVGAWNVPADMPAMIHRNEMVVPATYASGLRAAMGGQGDGGGSGGETHYHNYTIHANDAASFSDMLHRNASAVGAAVGRAARNGMFRP